MSPTTDNVTIVLKSRPRGTPTADNFEFRAGARPSPKDGEVQYETLYLSVDPYLRGRMNEGKSYVPPFEIGGAIASGFVGRVLESKTPKFKTGDLVTGLGPWSAYAALGAGGLHLLPPEFPVTSPLGVLGMPGLTAYVGLVDIGRAKAGETVVVSAAAGAVGSVVVQLAKVRGCRVVAIAGGAEKCAYVRDALGADVCIDYKTEDVASALRRHCPDEIDVDFENVGGPIFQAIIENLRDHARIALCGMISEYNAVELPPGPNLVNVLKTKSLIQGFIVGEHFARLPAFLAEVAPLVKAGKITYREDISVGLQTAPDALLRVLAGKNFGKQLVRVAT